MRARVAYDAMIRRVLPRALPGLPRALALLLSLPLLVLCAGCGDDRSKVDAQATAPKSPAGPPPAAALAPAAPAAPTAPAAPAAPVAPVPPSRAARAKVAPPAEAPQDGTPLPKGASSRWYDVRLEGKRTATYHVVWSASTWKGKPTVRDVTTERSAEAREMGPMVDLFSSTTVTETERGEDGTLWFTRSSKREPQGEGMVDRLTVEQTTWTGDGYDYVGTLNGQENKKRIATTEPTTLDAESFLGTRVARGEVKPGDRFAMRLAHVPKQRVVEQTLEVVGTETVADAEGSVSALKVRQTDPETKSETLLWFDADGVIVRLKAGSLEIRRVTEAVARERQSEPASFSITLEASPSLERSFSADKLFVDVKLKGDPDRPLPEFPDSPWSRPLGVEGSDAKGWTIHTEFRAYDAPAGAQATIPVTDERFAKDLEPTLLMPCFDESVQSAAKGALQGETDAKRAVAKLSEFVFTRLRKQSGPVPEATAVEILRDRMGDCSEHALLFVALCRASGIPARRCSGFVCVGSLWGSHAWAEVWVGAWMGVDPTTNDVGTAARYLFYGYSDDPDSHPGVVSSRAARRMSLRIVRLEEGAEVVDLTDEKSLRAVDEEKRRADQRLVGLTFRDLPDGWRVSLPDEDEARSRGDAVVKGPGFKAEVRVMADQGYRGTRHLRSRVRGAKAREGTFAGAPAVYGSSPRGRVVAVASRRRLVQIDVETDRDAASGDDVLARLETVMAASFAPKPDGK
jgi:transglutaminase-like putative cysteine protease